MRFCRSADSRFFTADFRRTKIRRRIRLSVPTWGLLARTSWSELQRSPRNRVISLALFTLQISSFCFVAISTQLALPRLASIARPHPMGVSTAWPRVAMPLKSHGPSDPLKYMQNGLKWTNIGAVKNWKLWQFGLSGFLVTPSGSNSEGVDTPLPHQCVFGGS